MICYVNESNGEAMTTEKILRKLEPFVDAVVFSTHTAVFPKMLPRSSDNFMTYCHQEVTFA
jgi:hypothetical protein